MFALGSRQVVDVSAGRRHTVGLLRAVDDEGRESVIAFGCGANNMGQLGLDPGVCVGVFVCCLLSFFAVVLPQKRTIPSRVRCLVGGWQTILQRSGWRCCTL